MERYEFIRQIGKGSFGSVWLAARKNDGAQFCIKQMTIKNVNAAELDSCQNEVRLLAQLEHPGIVSLIESFMDSSRSTLYIVMTYCEGGDLSHFLENRKKLVQSAVSNSFKHYLPEKEIWYFFIQMSLSLLFMHDLNILHRDLKTQNIFLKNGFLQLGDFGISKAMNTATDFAATCIGTPYYMSPELFKNEKYNFKSDVWALGCILYELTTFKHAFDANSLNNLAAKVIKGQFTNIRAEYTPELKDLIMRMLSTSPRQRPSIRDILTMPFMKVKLKKFVHTVIKHKEIYRTQDIINFEKQITSLGCADMLRLDDPPVEQSIKQSNNQPLSVGQAQQRALELLREEERERAKMGDALSQLKAARARVPVPNKNFVMPPPMPVQVAPPADKRRSSKDVYPAPPSNHAAIADLRRVEERRREREDLAKREDLARRREEAARQAAERERLREVEQRKNEHLQRMHREQALRRRQYNDSRAKQERREQEAKLEIERVKLDRERIQRHLRDIDQRSSRPSSAQASIQATVQSPIIINQTPNNQPSVISSHQDERDVESLNDRDRVLARKEKARLERDAAERARLNQARADYDNERAHAAQLNKYAINGYPNGQAPTNAHSNPIATPHVQPPSRSAPRASEPVEPPTEELTDSVDIEELEEELQNYDRNLQTLKTAMQLTALIDEIGESDDETDHVDDSDDDDEDDFEEEDLDDPHAHLFVTIEERLQLLGKECLRLCGKPTFIAGYNWLSSLHESGRRGDLSESELLAEAALHMGDRASHWIMLDQLLFMEAHLDEQEQ